MYINKKHYFTYANHMYCKIFMFLLLLFFIIDVDTASESDHCDLCSKTFNCPSNLRQHLIRIHQCDPDTVKQLVPRKKKGASYKYNCTQCRKSFNNICNFKFHVKVHKG